VDTGRLFTSINELIECCNTTTPEDDDTDTVTELLSQLEQKKAILTDLVTRIASIIDEGELESEVLESEDLQMEISRTIVKGKRLQSRLQVLELPSSVIPTPKDKPVDSPTRDTPTATLDAVVETKDIPPSHESSSPGTRAADSDTHPSGPPTPLLSTHVANSTVHFLW